LKAELPDKKKAVLMLLRSFLVFMDISKLEFDQTILFHKLFMFLKQMINSENRKLIVPILELLINLTSGIDILEKMKAGKPDSTFEEPEQWWSKSNKCKSQFLQHLIVCLNPVT